MKTITYVKYPNRRLYDMILIVCSG